MDDTVVVEKRSDLKNSENLFNLFISPYHQSAPYTGLFRPVTMASYALNYAAFGSDPAGFHVINIIIHALNVVLVFVVLNLVTRNKLLAGGVALLFLAHPIHTEAVTSIVGRAELLAFGFGILAAVFALRNNIWLGGTAFFLALLSKESAIAFLPIILYLWRWQQNWAWPVVVKRGGQFAAALLPYFLLRYVALKEYIFKSDGVSFVENPLAFLSWGERVATALKVLFLYLAKLIWPVKLSADYSYQSFSLVGNLFGSWQALVGLGILTGLVWLLAAKRRSFYGVAAGLFLFPFLVISNLFLPIGTIMGERLMYLPSLGILIIIGLILLRLRPKIYLTAIILLAIMGGVLTVDRNRDWLTSERVLAATVAVNSNAVITRTGLAAHSLEKDDLAVARAQLVETEKIYADYSPLQNLLGVVAAKENDFKEAERRYLRALALNGRSLNARDNLVDLYLNKKDYSSAARHLSELVKLNPSQDAVIRYGYLLLLLNQPAEAIAVAQRYLARQPEMNFFTIIGTGYFMQQNYGAALPKLRQARSLGNTIVQINEMIEISEKMLK